MNKDFDLLHVRIIGFSGQQTIRNPAALADAIRAQLEKIQSPGRRLMALAPFRDPVDLIFAQEALRQEIPLVILLPFPSVELRKNFSEEAAREFDQILQRAAKIEVLLLSPQADAATRIGQKLVDESDVILTVSDLTETTTAGDTAEVIAYASRRGRPVICLRETANGVEVRDLKSEKDVQEPLLSIEQLEEMLGTAPDHAPLPEGLSRYFHACDTYATNTAPKVRRYVLDIVMANAIASVAGSVGSSFAHSHAIGITLTILKFGSIFLGLGIFAVLRHRQSRNQWLGFRLKAEVCRSAIATWYSRAPIEPLTSDEVPELHPLLQALRYYRATHQSSLPEISLDEFKAFYGKRRLIDQFRYFRKQATSASTMSKKLTPVYWSLSMSALIISGLSLFLPPSVWPHDTFGRTMNFIIIMVPIVGPALASWIIAWQAIESVSRKQARFVEMERLMHQSLVDLIHCHSWEAAQHVVKRAERQLLAEVLEWYSFVKYSS
jgi:hypothetical protein